MSLKKIVQPFIQAIIHGYLPKITIKGNGKSKSKLVSTVLDIWMSLNAGSLAETTW